MGRDANTKAAGVNFFDWPGWDWLQLIASVVGLIAAAAFVVRYSRDAGRDAWRNPFGRFMLKRKALLTALFLLILVNRWHGSVVTAESWTGQDFVTSIVFSWFALQTWTPYRLLVDAQRAHKKEEASP